MTAPSPAATRTELAVPSSFKAEVYWLGRRTATIGNFLEELRLKAGHLTTASVVEAASKPGSILRDHFEWGQAKAAQKYRLMQARQLLRRLFVHGPSRADPIRAFIGVQIKGESIKGEESEPHKLMYLPMTAALQTENFRREILGRMRARAKAYEAQLSTIRLYGGRA